MKKILIIFSIIFHFSTNVYAQEFKLEKIVDGLDKPWSLSFIDKENILFTEKPGKLYSLNLKNKKISEIKHDLKCIRIWSRWITRCFIQRSKCLYFLL